MTTVGAGGRLPADGRPEPTGRQFDEPRRWTSASRRFRGGIGLQELLLEAAWANGYTGRNFRDSRAVLRLRLRPHRSRRRSRRSTSAASCRTWPTSSCWKASSASSGPGGTSAPVRNVSDFKTVTSYRLIGKDQYEQVAPGGELKHGTLGERAVQQQGRHLRPDAVDRPPRHHQRRPGRDHHGAPQAGPRLGPEDQRHLLDDVPEQRRVLHGRQQELPQRRRHGAVDRRPDQGEVAFMDQVDADGKPIGIMPAILLVPTALSAIGTQLFKSMELRDTTSSTKYPVTNPHQGKFRVEVSRYLSNTQLHRQLGQGLVPAGRPERPAGDRGRVPQRPGVAHDRDGRGRLQRARHPDARLPRLRCGSAGSARRPEEQGRSVSEARSTS